MFPQKTTEPQNQPGSNKQESNVENQSFSQPQPISYISPKIDRINTSLRIDEELARLELDEFVQSLEEPQEGGRDHKQNKPNFTSVELGENLKTLKTNVADGLVQFAGEP